MLAQRGGLKKVEPLLTQPGFAWQVMCLRLAIIACHARGEVMADALKLNATGGVATLSAPADWMAANPRTLHLLNEEAGTWDKGGPLALQIRS